MKHIITNINEYHNNFYKLIKSDNFKKWFGDWENDSNNSSKMIDDKGLPKIYYKSMKGYIPFIGDINGYNYNITLATPRESLAKGFSYGRPTYPIFIRSIKPYDFRIKEELNWLMDIICTEEYAKKYTDFVNTLSDIKNGYEYTIDDLKSGLADGVYTVMEWEDVYNTLKENGYDSFYVVEDLETHLEPNVAVFKGNQIKLANGINTTFDINSNNISE